MSDDQKQYFSIAAPIVLIAQELKAILQENLNNVNVNDFIAKVEGVEISADRLLGTMSEGRPRIKFDIDSAPQIEGFLKTFINKFNNTNELKDFIKFVVGSASLGLEDQIKVHILLDSSVGHLPITHTCFQSIEFPPYTDYETFEKKLLEGLSAKNTFGLQ